MLQEIIYNGKTLEVEISLVGYGDKMFEVSTEEGIDKWKKSTCYQKWNQIPQESDKQYDKNIEPPLLLRIENPPEEFLQEFFPSEVGLKETP